MRRRLFIWWTLVVVVSAIVVPYTVWEHRHQIAFRVAFAESVAHCRNGKSPWLCEAALAASASCTKNRAAAYVENFCLKMAQSPETFERNVAIIVLYYRPNLRKATIKRLLELAEAPPNGNSSQSYESLVQHFRDRGLEVGKGKEK